MVAHQVNLIHTFLHRQLGFPFFKNFNSMFKRSISFLSSPLSCAVPLYRYTTACLLFLSPNCRSKIQRDNICFGLFIGHRVADRPAVSCRLLLAAKPCDVQYSSCIIDSVLLCAYNLIFPTQKVLIYSTQFQFPLLLNKTNSPQQQLNTLSFENRLRFSYLFFLFFSSF